MIIDILLVIVAAYGFYIGYSRGIIKTVFYLFSILAGFIIAVKMASPTADLLSNIFNTQMPLMHLIAFILCLVLVIYLIRLIARAIEGFLKKININFVNKFIGGMITSTLLIALFSALLLFAVRSNLVKDQALNDSVTYPYLKEIPAEMKELATKIQPKLNEIWNDSNDLIDKMKEPEE